MSQERIKAMLMQNFGGQVKGIMVFLTVAYGKRLYSEFKVNSS